GAGYQYIVEVSYHKVGVVILEVRRGNGQHQAREAADGKQNYEGDGEEHGCFKGHGAFEHGGCPVEHFYACGHSDQHGGIHEEQLTGQRHARSKHVVRPHDKTEEGDGGGGVYHG